MVVIAPQRDNDLREVFNGLRWIVRTGAQWRMMPTNLPPWPTIYQQTQRWISASAFEAMAHDLRVLLRLAEGHADDFRAITTEAQWRNPQMILSVFAENTFATRWLDGVTQMLESTTYTHIWEQGYESLAATATAGSDWRAAAGAAVEKVIELWYELDAGYEE